MRRSQHPSPCDQSTPTLWHTRFQVEVCARLHLVDGRHPRVLVRLGEDASDDAVASVGLTAIWKGQGLKNISWLENLGFLSQSGYFKCLKQ